MGQKLYVRWATAPRPSLLSRGNEAFQRDFFAWEAGLKSLLGLWDDAQTNKTEHMSPYTCPLDARTLTKRATPKDLLVHLDILLLALPSSLVYLHYTTP